MEPSAFTVEPPPSASATELLTPNSWPPLTASLLPAATAPSATPISLRSPSVPVKSTVAPSWSLATVMFRVVASCCTRPIVPSFRLLVMFVTSPAMFEHHQQPERRDDRSGAAGRDHPEHH